jgi:hypothetical protein
MQHYVSQFLCHRKRLQDGKCMLLYANGLSLHIFYLSYDLMSLSHFLSNLIYGVGYKKRQRILVEFKNCSIDSLVCPKRDADSTHLGRGKDVALGGLVVSVLATGPQVRGFDPGRSTTSFGGEVQPSVPCRRFTTCKRTLRA